MGTTKKALIIQEWNPLLKFLPLGDYDEIYSYKSVLDRLKNCKAKLTVVSEDMMTARAYIRCEHQACLNAEALYQAMVTERELKPLKIIGDDAFARLSLKRRIIQQAENVLNPFCFAKKIKKIFGLRDNVDLIPWKNMSYANYRVMRRLGMLPDAVRLPPIMAIFFLARDLAKTLYFSLQTAFYPEILLFKARGKQAPKDKSFPIGVHYHDGRRLTARFDGMDFIIDNDKIKKEDVLFVVDEKIPDQSLKNATKQAEDAGYHLVSFFDDLVVSTPRAQVIKKYAVFSRLRFEVLFSLVRSTWHTSALFRAFRDYCLWEIFYTRYSVKKFYSWMHPGEPTRVVLNRRYGSESIFIYNSITHDRLDRGNNKHIGEKVYYSYMMFDKLVSDKVTIDWMQRSQNEINEYVDVGVLFADTVRYLRENEKDEIRKKLGVDDKFKLISFFDHTVGKIGVMNFVDYHLFLESMERLLNDNPCYVIAYKMKKKFGIGVYARAANVDVIVQRLLDHPRFIMVDNKTTLNYELMAASDLVVSAPLSSVIYEAVTGGVRTLSYDPLARYAQPHILTEHLPKFSAHNYKELQGCAQYWLDQCDEANFLQFQNDYIKKQIDAYCDGHSIERLRSLLTS